jgi:hypothetical protein
MRKRIEWEWETLEQTESIMTQRVKVMGGWLIRTVAQTPKGIIAMAQHFLSDQHHEWSILEAPKADLKVERSALAKEFDA